MANIPWPASSAPGRNAQESGGRLINAFAKKAPPGAPNPVVWHRAPGLRELIDVVSHTHCRGFILESGTLLAVFDTRVWAITVSGTTFSAVNLGALSGTDLVTIAKNNAGTPNITAVCSAGAFNLFTGSAPTSFADVDVGSPNSVSALDGYFLFTYGDGKIRATGVNGVTIDSTAFTTAQSRAGGLLRGVSYRKEFFAFGPTFLEVYRDAATSPFPLELVTMIPRGIVGTHAVSGWEEGWSNELCWVSDDNVVYRLNGYTPDPISTEDVSRDIGALGSADKALIQCSVAMADDHAFLIVKSPDNFTWVRDMTTGEWHERASYAQDDFRASCSVKAFGLWIMGDDTTGKLASFEQGHYQEFGNPLVFQIESGIASMFPSRANIPRADFHFTAGTGVASGSTEQADPKVMISWSRDGGASYGNELQRELGPQGVYKNHPFVTRCGNTSGHGIRFRLKVSDAVHVGFMGGTNPAQQLAE